MLPGPVTGRRKAQIASLFRCTQSNTDIIQTVWQISIDVPLKHILRMRPWPCAMVIISNHSYSAITLSHNSQHYHVLIKKY